MQSFEELACYQEARGFRNSISKFCKGLPREEEYRLKDQMIRASRSITANIAEGYGRHHHQENMQFCRHSRGSLTEMIDHLNVALDEGYISDQSYKEYRSGAEMVLKILNGYIAYIGKCAKEGVPKKVLDQSTQNSG